MLTQLDEAGHIQMQTTQGAAWEHVSFGVVPYSYEDSYAPRSGDRPDFFGDVRTRRAIALCMDRAQLNSVLYGNEAITTCVQCETPICPLCASETNQVHLCLNCYGARVEELSTRLSGASARLAKERQKKEAKALRKRKKKGEVPVVPAPEAQAAYELGAEQDLWERGEAPPVEAPAEEAASAPLNLQAAALVPQ